MKLPAAQFATLIVALVAAGAAWAGVVGAAFGLFAGLTVGGGGMCLFSRSATEGAAALLSTVLGSAGLFLMLGSDFLAVAQVTIGAGGVFAFSLFGTIPEPQARAERGRSRIAIALLVLATAGAFLAWRCGGVAAFTRDDSGNAPTSDGEAIGLALVDPSRYAVAFQLVAVLLTVALVAATALARRRDGEEAK